MPKYEQVESGRLLMGKLDHGSDLLDSLNRVCAEAQITLGRVEAIGAVQCACLAYYNQQTHEYQPVTLDGAREITHLMGNVSLKEGAPFVHAHVTLADSAGNVAGGHLSPGTIVFACEFIIEAFAGPRFERGVDAVTGLPLWV